MHPDQILEAEESRSGIPLGEAVEPEYQMEDDDSADS